MSDDGDDNHSNCYHIRLCNDLDEVNDTETFPCKTPPVGICLSVHKKYATRSDPVCSWALLEIWDDVDEFCQHYNVDPADPWKGCSINLNCWEVLQMLPDAAYSPMYITHWKPTRDDVANLRRINRTAIRLNESGDESFREFARRWKQLIEITRAPLTEAVSRKSEFQHLLQETLAMLPPWASTVDVSMAKSMANIISPSGRIRTGPYLSA